MSAIGAMHDFEGSENAEIKGSLADWFATEDVGGWLSSLAHEGRKAAVPDRSRMKEMRHTAGEWDIDPAFDQCGISLAITVADNPISQPQLPHIGRVEAPIFVMSVEANVGSFRRKIIREISVAAAEKHA